VSLQHQDGRWMVALTGSGREQARGL
jgi:hypothetical protein